MLAIKRIDAAGFNQTSDDNGRYYGVWSAIINGHPCSISKVNDCDRYWIEANLPIDGGGTDITVNGHHKTLIKAVSGLNSWLNSLPSGARKP